MNCSFGELVCSEDAIQVVLTTAKGLAKDKIQTGARQIFDCDVLVMGGGLAACLADLNASKRDSHAFLMDEVQLGRSGSIPAYVGVPQAAFGHADPTDRV